MSPHPPSVPIKIKANMCRETGPYEQVTSGSNDDQGDEEDRWYEEHLRPVMQALGGCHHGHVFLDLGSHMGDTVDKFFGQPSSSGAEGQSITAIN